MEWLLLLLLSHNSRLQDSYFQRDSMQGDSGSKGSKTNFIKSRQVQVVSPWRQEASDVRAIKPNIYINLHFNRII